MIVDLDLGLHPMTENKNVSNKYSQGLLQVRIPSAISPIQESILDWIQKSIQSSNQYLSQDTKNQKTCIFRQAETSAPSYHFQNVNNGQVRFYAKFHRLWLAECKAIAQNHSNVLFSIPNAHRRGRFRVVYFDLRLPF